MTADEELAASCNHLLGKASESRLVTFEQQHIEWKQLNNQPFLRPSFDPLKSVL
eukprot:SAG31_NODE_2489_length_5618_cov_2.136981_2_plen_54_part_00